MVRHPLSLSHFPTSTIQLDRSTTMPRDVQARWTVHKDKENGKKYYYDRKTKKTTWDRPADLGPEEHDERWYKRVDEKGRVYFVQVSTRKTSWKLPKDGRIVKTPKRRKRRTEDAARTSVETTGVASSKKSPDKSVDLTELDMNIRGDARFNEKLGCLQSEIKTFCENVESSIAMMEKSLVAFDIAHGKAGGSV